MLAFQTLETFTITSRGWVGHVVTNPVEKPEADIIRELVGTVVLLDGVERKVLGVESWLVPGKIVRTGESIVICVERTD